MPRIVVSDVTTLHFSMLLGKSDSYPPVEGIVPPGQKW